MEGMPRPRPPHLHRETSRHGKTVWVVRIGKGPRTRLRAPYGSVEFKAEYQAAISGKPLPGAPALVRTSSLQWLWDSYRETGAWSGLAPATRQLLPAALTTTERTRKLSLSNGFSADC